MGPRCHAPRRRDAAAPRHAGRSARITLFRYDQGLSFQEYLASALQVEFVRGTDKGGGIGSILYSDRSATGGIVETFSYNESVGHVVALTSSTAATVETNRFDAFGNIVSESGSSLNNRLANTKEREVLLDLHGNVLLTLDDHGMRYYNPVTGRYINRDPTGYSDGLNVYLYVHCNPINRIDPLGLGDGWLMAIGKFLLPRPDQSYQAADEGFKTAMDPNADSLDRVAGGLACLGNAIDTVISLVPGKSGLQRKILGEVKNEIKAGEKKLEREIASKAEKKEAQTAAEDGVAQAAPAKKPIDETRPQHGTSEHDATAFNQTKSWEGAKDTVETRFNQALVGVDGKKLSNLRPDAQRIRKTSSGKNVVDVTEVRSPSQSAKEMDAKVSEFKKALGSDAGEVKWVDPKPGAVRKTDQ